MVQTGMPIGNYNLTAKGDANAMWACLKQILAPKRDC